MSESLISIKTSAQLSEAVAALKARQASEGELVREHFMLVYESVRPVKLLKSVLQVMAESEELKGHLLSTGVGIVVGHTSKKAFESVSDSPAKELLGTALQFGVTNVVARHPEMVMAASRGVLRFVRTAWRNRGQAQDELTEDELTEDEEAAVQYPNGAPQDQ